jgi:hypothetical protein
VKSLDSYDFTALPSLNKALVLELARCEYLARHENAIALGNAGTDKTHIALGLGLAACQKGLAVGFTTTAVLVHELDQRVRLRTPDWCPPRPPHHHVHILEMNDESYRAPPEQAPAARAQLRRQANRSATEHRMRMAPRGPSHHANRCIFAPPHRCIFSPPLTGVVVSTPCRSR